MDWLVKALINGAVQGVGQRIAWSREMKKAMGKLTTRMAELQVPIYEGASALDVHPMRLSPRENPMDVAWTAHVPHTQFRVYATQDYIVGCWRSALAVPASVVMHTTQGHLTWVHKEAQKVRPKDMPEPIRAMLDVTVDQPQSVELMHRTAAGYAYIQYCHDVPHTSFQYCHGAGYVLMGQPFDYERLVYIAQMLEQALVSPPWTKQG